MSNVEDYGVKVNFDNSDFNDNIDSSEKKLNSFQDTLSSFTSSLRNIRFNGNINLGELLNFAAIQTGIYRIKNEIQSIGDPIESVADKALRVVSNVVNSAVQQIKSGGMQRALNIEAAKFQIEGLKLDVDTFMEAADYAVSGTAYSLDAAAKAASQLGASGITQLEDLKKALRGISGVAAMANSDYESIAHIFTTVAGQGKLMTMQLQSLSTRGLNIAAELGKVLGKSEKEIREMVSDGLIDFKTFAMAMDDAFGEHAKDANKTFTGAMSNIKAALSRIGEAFATPYIQDMVGVFNQIRLSVNELKAELTDTGLFTKFSDVLKSLTDNVVRFFEELRFGIGQTPLFENISRLARSLFDTVGLIGNVLLKMNWGEFTQIGNSLASVVETIDLILWSLREAFDEVFGIRKVLSTFSSAIEWAFSLLDVFEELYDFDYKEVFVNWFNTIKEVLATIKEVFGISFDSRKAIKDMFTDGVKAAMDFFKTLKFSEETVENLKSIFGGIAAAINIVKDLIFSVFSFLSPVFSAAFGAVKGLGKEILKVLGYLGNFFMELNNAQKEQKMFEAFFNTLSKYFGYLFDFLKKIGGAFHDIFLGGTESGGEGSGLSFIEKIFAFLDKVGELANEAMNKFSFNGIDFKPIQDFLKNIANFGFSDSELNTAADGLEKSGGFIVKIIDWIKQMFGDLFSSKGNNSVVQSGSVEKTTKVTDFIENILIWIQDLITTIVQNTDPALLAAGVLGGLSALIAASATFLDALLSGIASILAVILGFVAEKDIKKFAESHDIFSQMDKFITAFNNLSNKIPSMVDSFSKAMSGFKPLSGIFDMGKDSFGEQIKKILTSLAILIGVIAVSLFAIALIPVDDLFKAVAALSIMSAVVVAVLVAAAVITKVAGTGTLKNPLMGIAGAFALISFSIIELATSVWILAKALEGYDIGQIALIVGTIATLLIVISGIMIAFSVFQTKVAVLPSDFMFLAGAFAIFGFAVAEIGLAIAAIAVAIQGVNITNAWAAVGMISVILGVATVIFAALAFFIKDNPAAGLNLLLAGAGMLLMLTGVSGIILAITNMLLIISMIDIEKVDKAMDALESIIIALGVIMVVLSVIGLIAGLAGELGSVGLLALGVAILTFAILIASLTLPLSAAAIAIAAFAGVLKSIKDLFGYLKDLAPEDAERIGDNLKEIIGSIAEGIPEYTGRRVLKGLEMAKKLFPEFLDFINGSLLPFIAQTILATSYPISDSMIKAFINIMSTAQSYLPEIFKILYNLFFGPSQIYETAIKWFDELWDRTTLWLTDRIPIWTEDIADILLLLISSINLAMEGKWEEFEEEIGKLISNTMDFINEVVTDAKAVTKFNELFTAIAQIISDAVHSDEVTSLVHDAFRDLAGEAISGFIEGIKDSDENGILDKLNIFGKISDWKFGDGLTLSAVSDANSMPSAKAAKEATAAFDAQFASQSGKTKAPTVTVYNNNSSDSFGIINSITKIVTDQVRSGSSNTFSFGD